MARDYAGSNRLVLLAHRSGALWIGAGGKGWPVEETADYPVRAGLDGVETQSLSKRPTRSAGRNGFVLGVDAEFMRRLAGAKQFQLSYGEAPTAVFDLAGAPSALARLRSCHAGQQAVSVPATASATGSVFEPFLLDASFPRRARYSRRRGASLFDDEDYPASAVRAGESGTVGFRAEIGPNGLVTDCTVTASSGSMALDLTTCRLIKSRARFDPALDEAGRLTTDWLSGQIVWSLPAG